MKRELHEEPQAGRLRGTLLDDEDPLKAAPPARAPRRGPRRWPWVVLGLLLVLVTAVGVVPRVASVGCVRRMILAKVNARMAPRTLAVDDWSLRWFGALSITGLHLSDPEHAAVLQVVTITSSRGLAAMLPLGKVDLGTISVDAPQLQVALPATREHATPAEEAEAAPHPFVLPTTDGAVRLLITGGRVEVTGMGPKPFVLENVGLDLGVPSLRRPVSLAFAAFVPWAQDAGRILLEGSLPSPAACLGAEPATAERLRCTVQALDLQGFRALLENLTGDAWLRSGVADGQIDVRYCGRESMQVQSDLAVVHCSIEPPGRLASPAGDIRLQADLDLTDGRLSIRQFAGSSPWGVVQAEGKIGLQPDEQGRRVGSLAAHVDADLAAVTRDFGSLLGLRDDLRMQSGHLRLDGTAVGTTNATDLLVALTTSNLTLRLGTELFALQPPPSLRLNLCLPDRQLPEVRELLLELPFGRLAGRGRVDQAAFKLDVDLDAFTKQAQRVMSSCPIMTGALHAEAGSRPDGDHIRVDGTVTADGVQANLQNGARLALRQGRLTASGDLPLVNGMPGTEWSNVRIGFQSDAGSCTGSAERVLPGASNRPPVLVGGQLKGEFDLATARQLFEPLLTGLPAATTIGGKISVNATAEMAGGQAKARANAVAQGVQMTTTAWDVREEDVRLRVAVDADFRQGSVRVFDTHFLSRAVTLDLPDWQVQLPSASQPLSVRGKANGEANLAVVSSWQRPGRNPQDAPSRMQGRLLFEAQGTSDTQGANLTAAATLEGFKLTRATPNADGTETRASFDEPHATLRVNAALPPDASRLTLNSLTVQTSLGALDAKGVVDSLRDQRLSDVSGTLAVDFDAISALLRAEGVKNLTLAGRQTRPFTFKGRLAGPAAAILSFGQGHAACYLSSVAAFGMNAGPSDLDVSLADGVVHLAYAPTLNQGKLSFAPSIEITGTPLVLSMPPRTHVLQNVALTQAMLDQMLEYVLPLLQGCRVAGGSVDLNILEGRMPLGATLQHDTVCSAVLTLHNVRLEPAGLMGSLLETVGHSGSEITLDKYEMTVECRDGRVRPSPVTLKVAGTKATMTGTVGLDGTLAYRVSLPLSAGLVGKKAAPFFEGITIEVPVSGTIRAPAVDRKALSSEVARQTRAAGEKAAGALMNGLLNNLKR